MMSALDPFLALRPPFLLLRRLEDLRDFLFFLEDLEVFLPFSASFFCSLGRSGSSSGRPS